MSADRVELPPGYVLLRLAHNGSPLLVPRAGVVVNIETSAGREVVYVRAGGEDYHVAGTFREVVEALAPAPWTPSEVRGTRVPASALAMPATPKAPALGMV